MNKRRVLPLLVFIPLLGAAVHGQTSTSTSQPSPTPPIANVDKENEVVKITTNLIRIDVSVTDKNGKPVQGLRPSDFEIFENGEKQKITAFSFVSSRRIPSSPKKIDGAPEIPIPTVQLRPEQVKRTIALLVDDLTLSFESVHFTRRALRKFVDQQMQKGDLVAIVRTGGGVGALQQFTADKRILYAAIDRLKWNPMGSGDVTAFQRFTPNPLEIMQSAGDPMISDEDIKNESDRIKGETDARNSRFASGTLGAISYAINGMSQLPGRKLAILFSDGFQLTVSDRWGDKVPSDLLVPLRQLIDLATRSSVVIYTIDARGLQYTGLSASDWLVTPNPASIREKVEQRREGFLETQAGLDYLADGTGGLAIKNQNDLNLGIDRVLEDQSYYLIGYEPDTNTFDPASRRFNVLDVKLLKGGHKVRFRSGFFNVAESANTKSAPQATLTPVQIIEKAIYSPFLSNEIPLQLNPLFGSDSENRSFVRSLLHIDAEKLTFADEKNGTKKIEFMVFAGSFGDRGQIVEQLGKTYSVTIPANAEKRVATEGIVYHFKFPITKPGAYQFRVVIRDVKSGRLGSASQFIEVPKLDDDKLTLSSIVIENLSLADWNKTFDLTQPLIATDPMSDTAKRRVKPGSVVRWGIEAYNAKVNEGKRPDLQTQVRVFREGKLIMQGALKPVDLSGQTDMTHIKAFGAASIGSQMDQGEYILQIVVIDNLAKGRRRIATQQIQFEVVGQ